MSVITKEEFMKVIFLDFDGVINCQKTYDDYIYRVKNNLPLDSFQAKAGPNLIIDEEKVKILGKIVKLTGAKIVLSSTHRADFKDGLENIQFAKSEAILDLFNKYNIDIVGITPIDTKNIATCREEQIKAYLNDHKEVDSFCVIDDDTDDLQTLKQFLIETKFDKNELDDGGLCQRHIGEAIKILNKKKKIY